MTANPCEQRLDALAAAAVGDLSGDELNDIQTHMESCTACAAYSASLEAAVGVLRDDAAASPSPERRARVVAAARAVLTAPRIVPFVPARGGLGGLIGAAAVAAVLLVLVGLGGGGATGIGPDSLFGDSPTASVVMEGGIFVRTDSATGVITRLTPHANVTVQAMEGDALRVGTLEIRFPSNYRGPRGTQRVSTPGGTVTVDAKPGARYLLEQWPGEAYVEAGALQRNADRTLTGDTGEVTLGEAVDALNRFLDKPCRVTPESAALRTRLTVTGASAQTCLNLLRSDARHAGLTVTLVAGTPTFQGSPTRDLARAPHTRREGSLFVEVSGKGRAVVEAAGSRERFEAVEGTQVMLAGRASGTWKSPTPETVLLLGRRIKVVGAGSSAAAVAVDGGEPAAVQPGTNLLGHTVRHVGANGIILERHYGLVRIGIAGQ